MSSYLSQFSVNETQDIFLPEEVFCLTGKYLEKNPVKGAEIDEQSSNVWIQDVRRSNKGNGRADTSSSSLNTSNGSTSTSQYETCQSTTNSVRSGRTAGSTKAASSKPIRHNMSFSNAQYSQQIEEMQQQERRPTPYVGRNSMEEALTTSFSKACIVPRPARCPPEMKQFRKQLPTHPFREHILHTIEHAQVTIIQGGTGCGKTTQIPQFLLEQAAEMRTPINILCTQPRRLPAIAIARRVARERGETLGETVGFHIRLEQMLCDKTVLTYCTSGVLLRKLTTDELAKDATHIILDEIHERETNTDYLLIALRQALKRRTDLKVILMSATLEGNLQTFMQYFRDYGIRNVEIPAQLYKVECLHLGDILALTGYMPQSNMGGMFNADEMAPTGGGGNGFANDGFADCMPPPLPVIAYGRRGRGRGTNRLSQSVRAISTTAQNAQMPFNQQSNNGNFSLFHGGDGDAFMRYMEHNLQQGLFPSSSALMSPGRQQPPPVPHPSPVTPACTGFGNYVQPQPFRYYQQIPPPQFEPSQMCQQLQPSFSAANYSPFSASSFAQMQQCEREESPFYSREVFVAPRAPLSIRPIGGFGTRERGRPVENDLEEQLCQLLPDRPGVFDPHYLPHFSQQIAQFPLDKLVDAYRDRGGRQWEDSADAELITEVVRYLMDSPMEGGILVFLPGYEEINEVHNRVSHLYESGQVENKPAIFMLHSQINSAGQQRVFERQPPGHRKVVLSTNIAEASLTIDDIVFVVDCGKAKEKGYNYSTRVNNLICKWVARSNAEQRKGRAGRCQPGFCFRLFTENDFLQLQATQTPEMKRTAIHDVCLHAKMFAPSNLSVRDFLRLAPDPPDDAAVQQSLLFLEQLGALFTEEEPEQPIPQLEQTSREQSRPHRGMKYMASCYSMQTIRHIKMYSDYSAQWGDYCAEEGPEPLLTRLGWVISHLPLEPQMARMLLFGLALRCFEPVLTLVASISYRDPFMLAVSEEQKQRSITARDQFSRMDYSDHLMLLRAFYKYSSEPPAFREQFCANKWLSEPGMRMVEGIRHQLFCELRRLRLLPSNVQRADEPTLNAYSSSWPMVQAAIVAGSYPNIGFVRPGSSRMHRIRTFVGKSCHLHPSSSLRRQFQSDNKRSEFLKQCTGGRAEPTFDYVVFQELIATDERDSSHALRTVTAVSQLPILLFSGPIRMPANCIKHFELVDPNNELRIARQKAKNARMEQWRAEQRQARKQLHQSRRAARKQRAEEIERSWDNGDYLPSKRSWNNGDYLPPTPRAQTNGRAAAPSDPYGWYTADDNKRAKDLGLEDSSSSDEELAMRFIPESPPEEPHELLELDQWFAFRGKFDQLQALLRLRMRVMSHFMHVLAHPDQAFNSKRDDQMLKCLNRALTASHRGVGFADVELSSARPDNSNKKSRTFIPHGQFGGQKRSSGGGFAQQNRPSNQPRNNWSEEAPASSSASNSREAMSQQLQQQGEWASSQRAKANQVYPEQQPQSHSSQQLQQRPRVMVHQKPRIFFRRRADN